MRLVRDVVDEFRFLPWLMQLGLVVLFIGGGLDVLYHVSPSDWTGTLELFLGREAYYAHLVTLIGMVITLVGLFSAQLVRFRKSHAGR